MKKFKLFKMLAVLIVLITSINTAWAGTKVLTVKAGETLYFDFTAISSPSSSEDGVCWRSETNQGDGSLPNDPNGGGTVIAVSFASDQDYYDDQAIAKTEKASWATIAPKARQEGQNMLKFNAAGTSYEWTTARTFTSGEKIYLRDVSGKMDGLSEGDKWKQDKFGSYDGHVYAYFMGRTDGGAEAWADALTCVEGSWNNFNAVYEFTVPHVDTESYTWTQVLFTRGTDATFENSNTKDQTRNLALEVGHNYFNICNSKGSDNKFRCGTGKYGYPAALVGEFNNWHAYANVATSTRYNASSQTIRIIPMDLTQGEDFTFKILCGNTYYGINSASTITSTITSWWQVFDAQGELTVTPDVTGTYYFQFNASDPYFSVYYPKARLTGNQIYYFDASASTNWTAETFSSKFYFRYYDSEANYDGGQMVLASTALDGPVYYKAAPDDDLLGSIVIDKYGEDGTGDKITSSGAGNAHARASITQNCVYIEAENASSSTPPLAWKTYCPPTTSETFANSGTTVISWTTGNGTSGNPYLVKTGTSIKATASAKKSVNDGDMTINYDFKVNGESQQAGTSNTFSYTASTNNTPYNVTMDAYTVYNLDGTTNSTKHTHATTLYYKALDTYSVGHSLTNIAWGSGRTGADQAAYSLDYTATLNTVTGYNRPGTITVMAGSTNITEHCTWNSSTGAITIPGAYITGNITITAAGVAKQSTITFDKDGGTDGATGTTATYAQEMTTVSVPHKIGYAFGGYWDTEGGTGNQYYNADGTSYAAWNKDTTSPTTLYAKWVLDNKTFKADAASKVWTDDANWTGGAPSNDYSSVAINGEVELSSSVHIGQLSFGDGGKLTISAGATLEVAGAITNSDESKIVIESSTTSQGALILNNSSSAKATVKIYAKVASHASFQCVAIPFTSISVSNSFSGSDVYTYVWHEGRGWERRGYYTDLSEFEGIALMQTGVHTYTISGTLVSTSNKTHTLNYSSGTYVGTNMFGNSWTAPIKIAAIEFADGAEQTVYICEDGSWKGYPKESAGETVIPAMQAYTVLATKASSITVKYKETVRDAVSHTAPLQAPKHNTTDEMTEVKLFVSDGERKTDLRLFENELFTNSFDNGWEARYIEGDGLSGQLYAQTDDRMTVLASPDLEGTVVGFIPGEATNYTISFEGDGEGYYLNDVKKEESTLIAEGNTYEFEADEATNATRFVVSKMPMKPTGVDEVADGSKARKQMIDGTLYIIRDGRIYDATGSLVK